jgi:hypothetical protein
VIDWWWITGGAMVKPPPPQIQSLVELMNTGALYRYNKSLRRYWRAVEDK